MTLSPFTRGTPLPELEPSPVCSSSAGEHLYPGSQRFQFNLAFMLSFPVPSLWRVQQPPLPTGGAQDLIEHVPVGTLGYPRAAILEPQFPRSGQFEDDRSPVSREPYRKALG